jgi:pyruvate dehydrogenase E2 component (dihydrolipoamide acetyltransferase)
VESAKAAVELTSPVGGRVLSVNVPAGAVAQRGEVLVVIDSQETYFGIVGSAPAVAPPAPTAAAEVSARVRAAPFVRKLAREMGISLEAVAGSGPQGRVRLSDLEQAKPHEESEDRIPLRGLRREIAEHMQTAMREAPQVTSMDLFDATELVKARDVLSKSAEAEGVKLTYLPFFVKACIEALKAVPEANAVVEADAIVLKRAYHIGVATAVPGGLVVPVVKHADRLTLQAIASEVERLTIAARERQSVPADLRGSTFTITSFGGLPGSPLFATPILNYPEVAILGIGRIDQHARVVDGQVVARLCVGVSLTFDHRVLDGEAAGRFMAVLKRYVEQPLELLLRH